MGKTTTYTVPNHIAHDLRTLSLMLHGDGLSIGSTFGQVSSAVDVSAPTLAPSQSKKFE